MTTMDIGDEARARGTFTDPADGGHLVDQGDVVCPLIAPNGTKSMGSVNKVSTGVYEVKFMVEEVGIYRGKFYSLKSRRAAAPFSVKGRTNTVPLPEDG